MVAVVRRQLGTRSVGHAGTLDPFATGLLVVLVGRATRLARFVEAMTKRYDAVVRLGAATDTDDLTGTMTEQWDGTTWPTIGAVDEALQAFVGESRQRPPAYSAKHVDGVRSHALARAGVAVELESVAVQVHEMVLRNYSPPDVEFTATVGRGTYVRAIARDLGEHLGTGAHCAALRRTATGGFEVARAIAPHDASAAALVPPADLVPHLPRRELTADELRAVGFGRAVPIEAQLRGTIALVANDGRLVAVAEARDDDLAHPVVVLEPAA